jgi:hypothetical protein
MKNTELLCANLEPADELPRCTCNGRVSRTKPVQVWLPTVWLPTVFLAKTIGRLEWDFKMGRLFQSSVPDLENTHEKSV